MKVKIHYLFSKNEKIGSKFISWGTRHLAPGYKTPSHVALLVQGRWVIESTIFTGVRVISYKKWLEINELIAKIPYTDSHIDYKEVKSKYKKIKNKSYDWPGVIYCGIHLVLNKYFDKPIPSKNKWESPNKYFCNEAVAKIMEMGYYGMKAPVQMLLSKAR